MVQRLEGSRDASTTPSLVQVTYSHAFETGPTWLGAFGTRAESCGEGRRGVIGLGTNGKVNTGWLMMKSRIFRSDIVNERLCRKSDERK